MPFSAKKLRAGSKRFRQIHGSNEKQKSQMLVKGQIYLMGREVFLNTVKHITLVGCPIMRF